ncbi:MAG: tRNA epoxyqueuosine(34) reductase QueG [Fimbriiglobus sp.]
MLRATEWRLHLAQGEAKRNPGMTSPTMTSPNLADDLRRECLARGFTLFGIAPATQADGFAHFEAWLEAGYAGTMDYLHKYREHRRHPSSVVAEVRSVVMLGYEYGPPEVQEHPGKIAAYAQRRDYHRKIWNHLNDLRDWLAARVPGTISHGTCDSAPLLERDFARRAGLGWFGKNTMILNKERGSFFFLAGFLTSLELPVSPSHEANHCGTCTACLVACPTDAFPKPGVLDATKCISYLTIEHRGAIPLAMREKIGDRLFGCDDCQTACPWNRFATANPQFPAAPELLALDPVELLSLNLNQFNKRFDGWPLLRARRSGLLRNACIVLGNTGTRSALPAIEPVTQDRDEVLAEAARWAIECITSRTAS